MQEQRQRAEGQGQDGAKSTPEPTVFLRPLASPVALGFGGLAVATLVLAAYQLGWVPTSQAHEVAWVLIVFAAPIQFIASVFGFFDRDTVVGTGIGIQAASWLLIGVLTLQSPPGQTTSTLGVFLLVAAGVLLPSVITASTSKVIAALVMGTTALRWILTGIYELAGAHPWKWVAGWTGLALCVVAVYAAIAMEMEDQKRKTVLPTFRTGRGRQAINGDFAAQVARVRQEAGVREQL